MYHETGVWSAFICWQVHVDRRPPATAYAWFSQIANAFGCLIRLQRSVTLATKRVLGFGAQHGGMEPSAQKLGRRGLASRAPLRTRVLAFCAPRSHRCSEGAAFHRIHCGGGYSRIRCGQCEAGRRGANFLALHRLENRLDSASAHSGHRPSSLFVGRTSRRDDPFLQDHGDGEFAQSTGLECVECPTRPRQPYVILVGDVLDRNVIPSRGRFPVGSSNSGRSMAWRTGSSDWFCPLGV
jgi:hypothetical protein